MSARGGLLEKPAPVKDRSGRLPQKSREIDAPRANGAPNVPVSRPAGERRPAGPARLRPLFDCWPEIAARVRLATDLRLFLDFDGTLVDFRSRPEQVSMGDEVRLTLEKLSRHKRVHVAMVSGRRRASLMQHVSVPRIQYFGLYGWEGEVPLRLSSSTSRALARARLKLGELPNKAPGIYIEDKGMSRRAFPRGLTPIPTLRACGTSQMACALPLGAAHHSRQQCLGNGPTPDSRKRDRH